MPRVPLLALLATVLVASGCGSDDRPVTDLAGPSLHARGHHAATRDAAPHAHRTRGATPHRPTAPGTTRPRLAPLVPFRRVPEAGHLLTADRMPELGGATTWTVVDEGPEDTQPVGACQKTSLASIGAVRAVRRSYTGSTDGAEDVRAVQVVASFADDKSAWRAHEVLRSWREDCEDRLEFPRKDVGPLQSVTVRVGTGDSYRTDYGPRSAGRGTAAGLGIVRNGSVLSLVEITTGPDYPAGRDPARVAVRRISATFD